MRPTRKAMRWINPRPSPRRCSRGCRIRWHRGSRSLPWRSAPLARSPFWMTASSRLCVCAAGQCLRCCAIATSRRWTPPPTMDATCWPISSASSMPSCARSRISASPRHRCGLSDGDRGGVKDLGQPKAPRPKNVVAGARQRIDAALAAEQNPFVRSGLVNASLDILEDIGDYPGAYKIAHEEIARASAPYYYKADLAEIAEKLGHKDEAVTLLDEAYRESQGAATRFQWGQLYISGLLRMAPKDSQRIEDAGTAVLGELDGPDRIYRRARVRLEKLDRELRTWNDAAKGAHADVLQGLRARMQQICVKIPDTEAARGSCDAFLKSA